MSFKLVGILIVILSAMCEAYGQIAFKFAAERGVARSAGVDSGALAAIRSAVRSRKWIAIGVSGFFLQSVLWTLALSRLEVSLAYPLASLDLIAIALISRAFLRERIRPRRWIGIALIVAGTALVGSS